MAVGNELDILTDVCWLIPALDTFPAYGVCLFIGTDSQAGSQEQSFSTCGHSWSVHGKPLVCLSQSQITKVALQEFDQG